jgi:hypothetical protein
MAGLDLETCKAIANAPLEDALTMLSIDDAEKQEGFSYQKLSGLTMYYNPAVLPARVYVSDDKVEMVYISASELQSTTPTQLEQIIDGGEPTQLRSRSGKKAKQYVHPEQGFAYSCQGEKIFFVEVFKGRPLEAYLEEIYEEPGPFIR